MAKEKKANKGGENPYEKNPEIENKDIKKLCLAPGTGVMFKLFDLGKLMFEGDKALVFRNTVGDLTRGFLSHVERTNGDGDYIKSVLGLEDSLKKLGKLALADVERYRIYEAEIIAVLKVLV